MKKILLTLSLFLALQSFSQITITSSNMPVIGDTLRFSNAALEPYVLSQYQRSGPNQTWNFDTLRVIGQTVQRFVSSSQTPYNTVPTNRIGLLFAETLSLGSNSVNDVYNFVNSSANDFSIDYRAVSVPTGNPLFPILRIEDQYLDKDEVFQFPLNYGDRDSSRFNFVFNNALLGVYYGSSGYRINNVDAWGAITTPYGKYDAIRVITDMVSLDSVSALGQNVGIPSHIREYQWIANEERIPIMKVNGLVTAGVFVPNEVEFRDIPRDNGRTQLTEANFTADVTSTQANTPVSFTNNSTGASSYQWDFTPKRVRYETGSATSKDISVSFLETGNFTVRLIVSEGNKSDTLERVNYISVNQGVPIVEFELENDSAIVNEDFVIQNVSQFGDSYTWSISPSTFEYRNGTGQLSADSIVIRFLKTGFYSVSLSSTNSSGNRTFTQNDAVKAHFPVGIEETSEDLNRLITLSPNPVNEGGEVTFQVDPSVKLQAVEFFDINGKLLQRIDLQNATKFAFVLPEVSGMYFVKILTNTGLITKKIVVE